MCSCYSKLLASHESLGSDKEMLYHLLEVVAEYFTHDRPGLYLRVLNFAWEAYAAIVLKKDPEDDHPDTHCCEEVDRLLDYIRELDQFHHRSRSTDVVRSPRLRNRLRRALYK